MSGNLYLMCGIPGSGKSTFLKNRVHSPTSIIISRDEIRFSLLKEGEDYFSHENEVTKIFWKRINEELDKGNNVFADQTSITPRSRKWLLKHIKRYNSANIIWVKASLETCLKRNEMRAGTKFYVPPETIKQMHSNFVEPSPIEGFAVIYLYESENNTLYYKEYLSKWIIDDDTEKFYAHCEHCGRIVDSRLLTEQCPTCKAYMLNGKHQE